MAATGSVAGGMVPEIIDFFNPSWGGLAAWRLFGQETASMPSRIATDPIYHSVRISFAPPSWVLFLSIALLMTFLLARKSEAWPLLRKLSERVDLVRLPGTLTLAFGRSQAQGPHARRARKGKEQGNGRGRGITPG